jgi:hypothetical protein
MLLFRTHTKSLIFLRFFPSPPKHRIDAVKIVCPALHPRTAASWAFFWLPGVVIDSWNRATFLDSSSSIVRSGGGRRTPVLQPRRLATQRRQLLLLRPWPPRWTPWRRRVHLHPPAHAEASPSPRLHPLRLHPQAQGRCTHIYTMKRISNLAFKK